MTLASKEAAGSISALKRGCPGTLLGHSAPSYSGEYEVIPRVTEQSLPTRDRHLARDILVHAIPYHEVENTERGTTAIIGGI